MPLFPHDVFQEAMYDILEHGCPYVLQQRDKAQNLLALEKPILCKNLTESLKLASMNKL